MECATNKMQEDMRPEMRKVQREMLQKKNWVNEMKNDWKVSISE